MVRNCCQAGDKDAARKRDTVAKQMRPDQLQAARGAVELWKPKDLDKTANTVDIPAEWSTVPQFTASLSNKQMILKTQAMLANLGFKPGPADGVMGSNTTKAIKEFQARAGISVNGKVTPGLISALEKST
jgi:localization factor PodJL